MSDTPSKPELMEKIDQGWRDLQAFIASLTPEQMTKPTDAAGWTVKDHLMHLAVWEGGMAELLHRRPRWEYMGLPTESWQNRDFDAMNAVIQQVHKDKSLDEVLQALESEHRRMLDTLQPLADADLQRPYNSYLPDSTRTDAVIAWVVGDTYEHYAQHIPWMRAIAAGGG